MLNDEHDESVERGRNLLERCHDRVVDSPGNPLPNAARFCADLFGHEEHRRLVYQGGEWYAWDGKCWPVLEESRLRADLYKYFDRAVCSDNYLKDFAPTRRKVDDLIDALRAIAHIPHKTMSPSWLAGRSKMPASEVVACANGLVHVPTRLLLPHTPTFYIHHAVPFDFHADPPEPRRWLRFLREIWNDDNESITALQELFGYLVAGDTRLQKMFLFVGPKRSGKGTIARVLKAMMGQYNVVGPTMSALGTNFGLSPLIGKPVAIISDARLGHKTDGSIVTERLLSISGEDLLTIDRKYRDPWTGKLPTRIIILSNELPRLADSSGALASRFIVWVLTRTFYGKENPSLTEELCKELPSIFKWSLDGLDKLHKRGRFMHFKASEEAILEMEDLGSPVGAFARDYCAIGPAYTVPVDTLYKAYCEWCEGHGPGKPSTQVFGRDLRAMFPSVRSTRTRNNDGTRSRNYEGIDLIHRG